MEADLICIDCVHYDKMNFSCTAFPRGIPEVIYSGSDDHSEPLNGQLNDIVFKPINKKTQ